MNITNRAAQGAPSRVSTSARRTLRVGWAALGLLPVSLIGALVLGDWLLERQGYSTHDDSLPAMVVLRTGIPALLLLVAPCITACLLGHRAVRQGHPGAAQLIVVGLTVGGTLLTLNIVQLVVRWVFG